MERNVRVRQLSVVPLLVYGVIEYLIGLAVVLSPFVFGFDGEDFATTLAVVLGVLILLVGLIGGTPVSAASLIPLVVHEAIVYLVALVLILFPFITGIRNENDATLFFVIIGAASFALTLATRFPRKTGSGSHDG